MNFHIVDMKDYHIQIESRNITCWDVQGATLILCLSFFVWKLPSAERMFVCIEYVGILILNLLSLQL